MNPFLKYVAHHLYDELNGNFQDTTIVFPNKRATLFFNNYLWQKNQDGKAMWTPEYTTISDLFVSLSKCNVADPIYLICQLYKVYLEHWPGTEKTFDELFPFLEMMLADFQDVDSNMVSAEKMFRNISDLQEMTDYSFLEEEQIKAIQRFFNTFKDSSMTEEKTRFSTLWDKLLGIYNDFRDSLLSNKDKMLYEGMLKRLVVEQMRATSSQRNQEKSTEGEFSDKEIESRLTSKTYVFVGFNVLNKTERELLKFIKNNRKTYFYWDYDSSYCSPKASEKNGYQRGFEAGMFIEENIREFGNAFEHDSDVYQNMKRHKNITFIQSPTEDAQARHINQWVKENVKFGDTLKETAIVLCNEKLLQPVLHSIPNSIANPSNPEDTDAAQPITLNVTMGYPLSETPVFSLVQSLLELQLHGKTKTAWRYKQVAAVLKHPYVRRMTKGESSKTLIQLTNANVIFPTDEAFKHNEILKSIFVMKLSKNLTTYLTDILSFAAESMPSSADNSNFSSQLYKESTFAAYTELNKLNNQQEQMKEMQQLSDSTYARIISKLLQRTTIPFHGEPANGLQVMGFLETRNLDFKNVILLSAGEGQMPRANKRPSLIPYSLQVAFGMTTIDKEVSIYAYYFYRLLQRAENITVMWNSSTEDGHKGEMSRFLLQLMVETDVIFKSDDEEHVQDFDLKAFVTPSESMKACNIAVKKTEEIMKRLHKRFDIATENTQEWKERHPDKESKLFLSASAIISYLKCPLQFFFKYVAGLRPDDDVSEDVDDAIFGDIFHFAMEQLYHPYEGRVLTSNMIDDMAKDEKNIQFLVDAGFQTLLFNKSKNNKEEKLGIQQINYSGAQLIKHHVLRQLIKMQLEADADTARKAEANGGSFTILETEKKHYKLCEIQPNESQPSFKVRIGGIIDRIDKIDNAVTQTIRVVDYKTSGTVHNASHIEDLFDGKKIGKNYHITQTMYYCDVLTDEGAFGANTIPVVPALMYYKNNLEKKDAVLSIYPPGKNGGAKPLVKNYATDCKDIFQPLMLDTITSIFREEYFEQCEDDTSCKNCDFKSLCRRTPKKDY